jgi:hypothetical protein
MSANTTTTASDTEHDSGSAASIGLNPTELIPDLFGKFFEFFRPGHTEGVTPARIKELARLKVASINDCDT